MFRIDSTRVVLRRLYSNHRQGKIKMLRPTIISIGKDLTINSVKHLANARSFLNDKSCRWLHGRSITFDRSLTSRILFFQLAVLLRFFCIQFQLQNLSIKLIVCLCLFSSLFPSLYSIQQKHENSKNKIKNHC